jgi:hypothetical protein
MSALNGDLTWGDIARWESFEPEGECEGCGKAFSDCTCPEYNEPEFCPHCHQEMP